MVFKISSFQFSYVFIGRLHYQLQVAGVRWFSRPPSNHPTIFMVRWVPPRPWSWWKRSPCSAPFGRWWNGRRHRHHSNQNQRWLDRASTYAKTCQTSPPQSTSSMVQKSRFIYPPHKPEKLPETYHIGKGSVFQSPIFSEKLRGCGGNRSGKSSMSSLVHVFRWDWFPKTTERCRLAHMIFPIQMGVEMKRFWKTTRIFAFPRSPKKANISSIHHRIAHHLRVSWGEGHWSNTKRSKFLLSKLRVCHNHLKQP